MSVGTRIGTRIGVSIGSRSDEASEWTLDATSGKALPQNEDEVNALLAAAGVPGAAIALYRFHDVGAIVAGTTVIPDDVGSRDLSTFVGETLTAQAAVPDWTAKSIKTDHGVPGRMLNSTFGNVNTTAATIYLIAAIDAMVSGGTTYTLVRYGAVFDDDATLELDVAATTHLQVGEGDTTRTDGSVDIVGTVRMFALSCGATIAGYHDLETVVGGARACNGTEVCFGGDNNDTWFPGDVRYVLGFIVNASHTEAQVQAVTQTAGW